MQKNWEPKTEPESAKIAEIKRLIQDERLTQRGGPYFDGLLLALKIVEEIESQ